MLEQVVRPFLSIDKISQRRIVKAVTTEDLPGQSILSWGGSGKVPAGIKIADDTGLEDISFEVIDCDENFTQVGRETEDVRIENPNDPDDYVIERRAKKISFTRDKKNSDFYVNDIRITIGPVPGLYTPDGLPVFSSTITGQHTCKNEYTLNYD